MIRIAQLVEDRELTCLATCLSGPSIGKAQFISHKTSLTIAQKAPSKKRRPHANDCLERRGIVDDEARGANEVFI